MRDDHEIFRPVDGTHHVMIAKVAARIYARVKLLKHTVYLFVFYSPCAD
jgi:hypothetical protein